MALISVLAKFISIMLLLVAVQAQESFPSDFSTLLSESESLHDSDENSVPLQTQQIPHVTEETSVPSANDLSLDFQDTNTVSVTPLETQSLPDENSVSSESEFPEDSEDTNETQQIGVETDHYSRKRRPPQSPPPSPSETPSTPESPLPRIAPSSSRGPSTPKACKANCAATCMRKKVPILHNLCSKNCRRRCILHFSQLIYHCTTQCAENMPKNFKSDKKKAAGYVDYCYQKCIKKF